MLGLVPVDGSGTMADTANAITRNEQLGMAQLTTLVADPKSTNNLANFIVGTVQHGAVSIVPTGASSPGTAITTNTTIYVRGIKTAVDVYHLPL
ncbi:MAG: hypothetical protein ABSD59_06045 [Terracidiphilus sp.]|jgi:hypothetical protein